MIDQQLAAFSNLAIVLAIVLYVIALFAFSADLTAISQRRGDARLAARETARERELAHAGAAAGVGSGATVTAGSGTTVAAGSGAPTAAAGADAHSPARRFGFTIVAAAATLHVLGVVLRGVATQRAPWANMYEFAMTSSAGVMVAFLLFAARRVELRRLGAFVVGPILLVMLLAQTFWIVPAAALTPSLQNSHWLYIHITVAIAATALSILGAVIIGMQLAQARHERMQARLMRGAVPAPEGTPSAVSAAPAEQQREHWGRFGRILDALPSSTRLEALSFRIHAFAFVCWTFTNIFGAIWAREAWGRFWGWDPKEVWTFVIWVLYAAYLHARATGGFRGTRAAWLALAGFVAVVFNYTIVNTVINGLHSYSGL